MFGTAHFDCTGVETYADALAYFERAKPWRGETDITDERPMEHRRHRNYGVRNNAGVIRFRMYNTDVVSYFPDGTIEFDVYSSLTTDSFANALLGLSIRTHFVSGYVEVDGLAYRAIDYVSILPDRTVQSTKKWSKYEVDRKAYNAAIKEYLPELPEAVAWFNAAVSMGALSMDDYDPGMFDQRLSLIERAKRLRNRENWKCLTPETLHILRKDFTHMHALVETERLDGIPVTKIDSYRAAWRKWGEPT